MYYVHRSKEQYVALEAIEAIDLIKTLVYSIYLKGNVKSIQFY